MEQQIKDFTSSLDLDIRKTKYRFMDQKVTPDVLSFIADTVLNFPDVDNIEFTKNDIWESSYFTKNIPLIYNKPSPSNETTTHEYDKFTAQPLKTLSYAKILIETQKNGKNFYKLNTKPFLQYIALSDKNAFIFLSIYLEKVLSDSGFINRIETYIGSYNDGQFTKSNFYDLKKSFEKFIIGSTNINGETEARRIFPKVLNIFSVKNRAPGSRGGRVTESPYSYSDLMYNAINFRDLRKMKNVSRQETNQIKKSKKQYSDYEMEKAKTAIKKRHFPNSEVNDRYSHGAATQVHHIFDKVNYSELKSTLENLILITPQQHNERAHPMNKTTVIDPGYQINCLLAKSNSVESSLINKDGFYSKESFINVVKKGLGMEIKPEWSFEQIRSMLNSKLTSG